MARIVQQFVTVRHYAFTGCPTAVIPAIMIGIYHQNEVCVGIERERM